MMLIIRNLNLISVQSWTYLCRRHVVFSRNKMRFASLAKIVLSLTLSNVFVCLFDRFQTVK